MDENVALLTRGANSTICAKPNLQRSNLTSLSANESFFRIARLITEGMIR